MYKIYATKDNTDYTYWEYLGVFKKVEDLYALKKVLAEYNAWQVCTYYDYEIATFNEYNIRELGETKEELILKLINKCIKGVI